MTVFKKYFVDTFKNRFAKFDGRASRSEYWYFQLFGVIIVSFIILTNFIFGHVGSNFSKLPTILIIVFAIASIIPNLALSVRRLHDSNRSGWMLLVGTIPYLGVFILLLLMCIGSTPGINQYGDNPYADNANSNSQNYDEIVDR